MNPLNLLEQAERWLEKGRSAQAIRSLRRAAEGNEDEFLKAEILSRLAETLRSEGKFKDALASYWNAYALYRKCGVASERLRTVLGASACLRVLSRYAEAGRAWKNVRRQGFFWAQRPSRAEVLLEIALVRRGLGHLSSVRRQLRMCVRLFQKAHDDEGLRHAWWALAGTERFSGHFKDSLHAFRQAGRLARRLKDESSRAYALCGRAGTLRVLGDGKRSFRLYQKAFGIFRRQNDFFGQAYGLCGMGNARRAFGDARKSVPLYKKSIDLYRRVGDEGSRAFAVWGLAGSHRRLKKLSLAVSEYRSALKTFKKVGDHRGIVMAQLGLARVRWKQGDGESARRLCEKAFLKARRSGLRYETALARFELSNYFDGKLPRYGILEAFGISPRVIKQWKDIP